MVKLATKGTQLTAEDKRRRQRIRSQSIHRLALGSAEMPNGELEANAHRLILFALSERVFSGDLDQWLQEMSPTFPDKTTKQTSKLNPLVRLLTICQLSDPTFAEKLGNLISETVLTAQKPGINFLSAEFWDSTPQLKRLLNGTAGEVDAGKFWQSNPDLREHFVP